MNEMKTEPQAKRETPVLRRYLLKMGIRIVEMAGNIGINQNISSNIIPLESLLYQLPHPL